MALTPEGTPYVEASDLVAAYPAASLSLANRVDLVGVLPFADSAARATAIPSPTDGQYSYLQDTNSTEFWNGSAWQAAGTTPGLNLITPTTIANSGGSASASGGEVTFTTVNSISLNGVFTATYNNYRIVINAVSSATSPGLQLRARNAGTDNTGATEYLSQNVYTADTGNPTRATATGSSHTLGVLGNTVAVSIVDICDPFLSTQTFYIGTTYSRNTSDLRLDLIAGNRITAASQDGLTVFPASGNFTGKIRVYGYKNS